MISRFLVRYAVQVNCFSRFILFLCSYFIALMGYAQEIDFKHVSVSDGLSHSTVYDITQDADGKMWFATREGLNSFDGLETKTFYHDTLNVSSISNNQVNVVESLRDGLYIGTFSGLDKFDPESGRFEKILPKGDKGIPINSILEADGDKYIGNLKYGVIDESELDNEELNNFESKNKDQNEEIENEDNDGDNIEN